MSEQSGTGAVGIEQKWLVNPGQSKTIDLDGVRSVKIGLVGGQIDVIGHDEPTARVVVHSVVHKDLKISFDGERLEIDHPQLRWDNLIHLPGFAGKAKAEISVLVPRGVSLKLGTVGGDALVSGIAGPVKLSTVSGDITADAVVGELELNGVSGELSAREHRGGVRAHTVSGDVTLAGSLPRVSVDGVSANVFLDLVGTPDTISSNTVSGDLTLRIDPGVAARYRINTVSGALQIDNSIFRGALAKNFQYQSGELDGHWIEVGANSVSGNVSVVRRTTAASGAAQAATA